jgi:glucose dehydrogenase
MWQFDCSGRLSVVLASMLLACAGSVRVQTGDDAFSPVTDAMLESPSAADWLMWRRTHNGWGYSPLDLISSDNAADLELVWSRPIGTGTQEPTPRVHDGVMFVPNNGDFIQAFESVTGDVVWEHNLGAPDSGDPIAFAVGQRQYVAVASGQSLVAARARRMTPELAPADAPATIFVFALSD